jgi:lipopolysaccharide transport system ATP-binding protein
LTAAVNPIIRFDHVSKRYRLRHGRPRSFRELFVRGGRRVGGQAPDRDTLWALRDACFEIQPAETVGLVGANGAGKSTVLKLISRVIMPNSGRIAVTGRVAALLELGAGFHPELSGRDNIYLSGALAGMSRQEINRKFDAIVAFSEMDRFIDMPVKHYSSGMFARLAFAVSIHLDPDVLLVDEVLAVGDQSFQQKCLERIAELKRQGLTIFFVSHDLETVGKLCQRALWMHQGRVQLDGVAGLVVQQYLDYAVSEQAGRSDADDGSGSHRWGSGTIEIHSVRLTNQAGARRAVFKTGEPLSIHLDYRAHTTVSEPIFGLAIHRLDGLHVTGPNTSLSTAIPAAVSGAGTVTYAIPCLPLLEGYYQVSVAATNFNDTEIYDYHDRLYSFQVSNPPGDRAERYGLMTLAGEWHHVSA